MKVSRSGVLEIAEHEGIVLGPYQDSVGVWTYGIGHTAAAGGINPETMDKVDTRAWSEDYARGQLLKILNLFDADLDKYEARVRQAIDVPISQSQFDALVSFDFNTGGIHRAKLTKAINSGASKAWRHFMGWTRPPEIKGRRVAEMRLFRTGDYSANGDNITVWDALPDGRLKHREVISGKVLASMMRSARTSHSPRIQSGWMRRQMARWFR